MTEKAITTLGVKEILIIASLVPLYMAFLTMLVGDGFTRFIWTLLVVVTLFHFYYGYKWAKFTVALFSLVFAASQFYINFDYLSNLNVLLLLFSCALLILNSFLLLQANAVRVFLAHQFVSRDKNVLFYLKMSRWVLFAVIGVATAQDLTRLL